MKTTHNVSRATKKVRGETIFVAIPIHRGKTPLNVARMTKQFAGRIKKNEKEQVERKKNVLKRDESLLGG